MIPAKKKKPVSAFPSHAMLEPPADYPLNPVVEQVYHNSLLREDTGENANNSAFSAYGYLFAPDIPCMMKPDPADSPCRAENLSNASVRHPDESDRYLPYKRGNPQPDHPP